MPSRRERAAAERKQQPPKVEDKSCQALHPVYGEQCWHGRPCQEGERHWIARHEASGELKKHYWRG